MNLWKLMILKDDWACSLINTINAFVKKCNLKEQKLIAQMRKKECMGVGKDLFIILNGPSLKKQDLNILKGKNLMFVNRGFNHPLYKELQPKFHAFIDTKMLNGEWPVSWLDEIATSVPGITFIMPAKWAFIDKFRPYIEKGYSFYWMQPDPVCTCLGVSGTCFRFAIAQKFNTIYITGFDANGLGYELISANNSHFYGVNEENLKKTTKDYVVDLLMHSRHLHDLNRFAAYCEKKKISVINLTDGGLLDMFPRKEIADCQ